jgi:NAD(P)-dependent dehydrogenase (short-subunit alcohol dehydrogenase family)
VYVSSIVHHLGYSGGIRWDAVDEPQGYVPWKAYSQSKLALILHARALNVELAARGSLLAVHAVHPGAVPTDGAEAAEAHSGAAGSCLSAVGGRFHRTVAQGAASVVYAVASPQCATPGRGCFVCNANRADGHASRLARDALTAFRLSDLGRSMTTGAERDEAAAAPPAEERAALPTSTAAGEAAA